MLNIRLLFILGVTLPFIEGQGDCNGILGSSNPSSDSGNTDTTPNDSNVNVRVEESDENVAGHPCASNNKKVSASGGFFRDQSSEGLGHLMQDTNLRITCCGIITSWEVNLNNVAAPQDLELQVWELVSGTTFELIGQNTYTATADGDFTVNVPASERISVRNGYRYGWRTNGAPIVTYKSAGASGYDNHVLMPLGQLSPGSTFDWSAGDTDNRDFAVQVRYAPSNTPYYTNLPDTVTQSIGIASGSNIFTVSASDDDTVDIPGLTLSMITTTSRFSFDQTSGEVTTAQSFSGASFSEVLVFRVVDDCGKTGSATLTVSIVNQPPVMYGFPTAVNVSEDTTDESQLLVINATDPEGMYSCDLATGSPFDVRLQAGGSKYELINTYNPNFDYATTNDYQLTVTCTDGEYTVSGIVYVYVVKNQPPSFVNLQNSAVISTTNGIGSTVFVVTCSDPESDVLQYAMTCDPPGCDFEIFDSGEIQVNADLSNTSIVGYDISVTCNDGRTTVGPSTLTVTFGDLNNPVTLSNLPSSVVIPENSPVGSSVLDVSFVDLDTSQAHTFYWSSGSTEGLSLFSIDPNTGSITTSSPLNYESLSSKSFTFDVTVADPVVSDTQTITIDVTDVNEAPSFSQSSYSISTNEGGANTIIGSPSFGITDPDSDATSVALNCGTEDAYFYMDASLNVLYQSDYDLDAGLLPSTVTCSLTVTDPDGLSDTATLYIYIANINDNVPAFGPSEYFYHVSYYATAGSSVGTLTATDGDSGNFGVLTYTLDQSSFSVPHFAIDNAGLLTVQTTPLGSAIGYGTTVSFNAIVSDSGGQSDTAKITITISDTTTTSTTTTTDFYLKFFDDKKNIAWFTISMVLLSAAIVLLIYIICTCNGSFGCRDLCRWRGRRFDFKDPPEDWDGNKGNLNMVSARNCPPPVNNQSWRNGWTGKS